MELAQAYSKNLKEGSPLQAIEFEGVWYSWGYLFQVASQLEEVLRRRNVPGGVPVGLVVQNRPDFMAAIAQLLVSGRCCAMISPLSGGERIAAQIRSAELGIIIASSEIWGASGSVVSVQ